MRGPREGAGLSGICTRHLAMCLLEQVDDEVDLRNVRVGDVGLAQFGALPDGNNSLFSIITVRGFGRDI